MTIAHFHDRGSFRLISGLPAPRQHEGTGAWIYPAILAQPGVHAYTTPVRGRVYTPASTLADPAWLDSLAGIPLVDDDYVHADGVSPEYLAQHRIGHIVRAWWSEPEQSVLAEVQVDTQRGLDQIAAGKTGLSVAYDGDPKAQTGDFNGAPFDFVVERRYNANNVELTSSPRHQGAALFADSEDPGMDPKKLMELLAKLAPDVAKRFADNAGADPISILLSMLLEQYGGRMAADAKCADMEAKMADMIQRPPPGDAAEDEADVEESAGEDMADAPAKRMADSIRLADRLGIELGEMTLAQLQRAILKKAGHRMADSLTGEALAASVETVRASTPEPDAWSGWERKPLNRETTTPSADPLDAV